MLRKLRESSEAVVDLALVLTIGVAFIGLMVGAYIIWVVYDAFDATADTSQEFTLSNITAGFDDAVNLLLIAVTIFILAIAIGALLMLRGRQ